MCSTNSINMLKNKSINVEIMMSYSITYSTVNSDTSLLSLIASYLLGFGMISWAISCVVVSYVASNHCDSSSFHFKFWLSSFVLAYSNSVWHFSSILLTISTNNSCGFSNPISIFLQHLFPPRKEMQFSVWGVYELTLFGSLSIS